MPRPMLSFVGAVTLILALGIALLPPAAQAQPNHPTPQPMTLDSATTAVLVLDLTPRCDVPGASCGELAPVIAEFLPKVRASHVLTVYTVSLSALGTPLGVVWEGFTPLGPDEVVLAPNGTDKFVGGELDDLLRERGITTLVITGASANGAVLYTASSAARNYGYDVVIPLDGTNADTPYEYEYVIHQFTVIPSVANRFSFTMLDLLRFASL